MKAEGRVTDTAEDFGSCSNLKYILSISQVAKLCYAFSLFSIQSNPMMLVIKEETEAHVHSPCKSERLQVAKLGLNPNALSQDLLTQPGPLPKVSRGAAFGSSLEEQVGFCHAATCEVAEMTKKPSQVKGQRGSQRAVHSLPLPPSGDFSLLL